MGVRVDLALWIYREHFAALALLGLLVAVARVTSHVVLGAYALPVVVLVSLAALVVTAGLVWCVARSEQPRVRAVLATLAKPLGQPGVTLRQVLRAVVRARVQLVLLALGALMLHQLIGEGVGAVSETVSIFGEWSEVTRLWVTSLSAGLLEPVLYIATALWLFDEEA